MVQAHEFNLNPTTKRSIGKPFLHLMFRVATEVREAPRIHDLETTHKLVGNVNFVWAYHHQIYKYGSLRV